MRKKKESFLASLSVVSTLLLTKFDSAGCDYYDSSQINCAVYGLYTSGLLCVWFCVLSCLVSTSVSIFKDRSPNVFAPGMSFFAGIVTYFAYWYTVTGIDFLGEMGCVAAPDNMRTIFVCQAVPQYAFVLAMTTWICYTLTDAPDWHVRIGNIFPQKK